MNTILGCLTMGMNGWILVNQGYIKFVGWMDTLHVC